MSQVLASRDSTADFSIKTTVMNTLSALDLVKDCLAEGGDLQTSHKRNSYAKKYSSFTESVSVYAGVDSRNKSHYHYYIPVKQTLLSLLKEESILCQCLDSPKSCSNVLSDYTDGMLYKRPTENSREKKHLTSASYSLSGLL